MRTKILCIGLAAVLLFLTTSVAAAGVVKKVFPTGSDDTVNIEKAFLSCVSSGPNCTVKLSAGTFYISRPIVIANFDGKFRGAGKGRTVVQNNYTVGERFPAAHFPLPATSSLFVFYTTTMEERGGSADNPANIAISDMTLKEIGLPVPYKYHLTQPWADVFADFVVVTGRVVEGTNIGMPAFIDVSFKRVEVAGEIDSSYPWGYNASYGLSVKGWVEKTSTWVESEGGWLITPDVFDPYPITGTFSWSDCSFAKLEVPIAVYGAVDAAVTIDDMEASDVLWSGVHIWGMRSLASTSTVNVSDMAIMNPAGSMASSSIVSAVNLWDNSAVAVSVSGVDTTNASGVTIRQWNVEPSTFVISHNDIDQRADPSYAGIEIWDYQDPASNFVIWGNEIHSEAAALSGPMFLWGVDDALVANNWITGYGPAAIYVGVDFWGGGDVNRLTLVGNNFHGWTTAAWNWLDPIAPIWLGWATNESTAIGGSDPRSVVDAGAGNIVLSHILEDMVTYGTLDSEAAEELLEQLDQTVVDERGEEDLADTAEAIDEFVEDVNELVEDGELADTAEVADMIGALEEAAAALLLAQELAGGADDGDDDDDDEDDDDDDDD